MYIYGQVIKELGLSCKYKEVQSQKPENVLTHMKRIKKRENGYYRRHYQNVQDTPGAGLRILSVHDSRHRMFFYPQKNSEKALDPAGTLMTINRPPAITAAYGFI